MVHILNKEQLKEMLEAFDYSGNNEVALSGAELIMAYESLIDDYNYILELLRLTVEAIDARSDE